MLSAGDVPFGTEQEYKDALADAMTAAGECVQANAQNSAGRNLKSWGAQVVKDHPLEGLTALTRICKNAAVFGTSGTTLAEASESGVLDAVVEITTSLIRSVVSLSLASLTSDASGYISATKPPTAIATDAVFGKVLNTLLYPESEATCQSEFGKQACLDLRSSSDTSIRSWVQTSTCQTCSDYLLKACKSNVNRQYATKFKTIVGLSNIISSFPNGILFTHRALGAASAAAVMGPCGLSAEAFAEARSNQAGLIIVSLKESALLPLWRTWSLARSFINQPGWLAQQSVRTGFTAARESATAWASRFVLASSRIYVADSQIQVLSAVKRPYCTNQLISDTDPCRPGERVWCCAGVKSSSQLQGPCQYLGYAGTTTACDNSDMPMRYCCPTTQNPGPLPAGVVEEVTVVTPEGVKTTTVTRG